MTPTDEQAGSGAAISSLDWRIIRLMLETEPRKSAAGIYNQVMRLGDHPVIPADFQTSHRWEGICRRLRTAAAIGDTEPTPQQSEHLLSVVDEAADAFNEALEESSPPGRSKKRKPDAAAGPTPKRQNTTKRKRVYASWDEIRVPLDSLLAVVNREISAWLVKEHHLPLWTPPPNSSWHLPEYHAALEHVVSLHLPRTPAASGVCLADLLLYKLGESEDLDPGFKEKKEDVKAGNAHQVIANVSGAGKTRMSLEVLADDWSIYFTADYNSVVNPYGSQDIKTALVDLAYSTDAAGNPFHAHVRMTRGGDSVHPIEGVSMGTQNAAMARQVFAAVALARVLVHAQFLDAYKRMPPDLRGTLPAGPKLWLLLQVCPVLEGRDIFLDVYLILKDLSFTDLRSKITSYLTAWAAADHLIARVAIDEVQHLVDTYPTAFVGTKKQNVIPTRPVFKPLVNALASFFLKTRGETRFLLAGTQLCVASAFKAVVSTAVKNAVVVESSVTAAHFDRKAGTSEFDPAPIVHYLSHFLTGEVVAGFGDLMRDIVFWLRGRPRFLSYFVQWVLQKGPNAARAVLLNIVSKLTDVELDVCAAPGPPVTGIGEMQLRPLLSSTLTNESENLCTKDGTVTDSCRTIVRALLNLLIEGRYTRISHSHAKLVELGVGKFDETTTSCWIRENLVLARLFAYFSTDEGHNTFIKAINDGLQHPQGTSSGFAFENALILLFWRLFTSSTPTLSSVLTFFGPSANNVPSWATRRARLVWYFDGDTPVFASSAKFAVGLAASGSKPTDTLSWLRNETRLPFFKPDKYLGPDVCLRLAVERAVPNTYDIITLCIQGKFGTSALSDADLRRAIYTASPEHFYTEWHTASRNAVLEVLPRWGASTPSHGGQDGNEDEDEEDDDGDGDDDDVSIASGPPDSGTDVVVDYSVPTPPDLALLRVLATTKHVQQFIDTAGGLGTYPLAYMPLTTFQRGVTNFNISGFQAALEAADASLAASYASGSRPVTRSMRQAQSSNSG